MAPSPDLYHQDILLNLATLLRNYLKKNPVGTVHIAPSDVHLTDRNVFQPDLYFVVKERQKILSKQGAEGAPDLIVEVLSTKTARVDKGVKREVYARTGVKELWLVDPELRILQVYRFAKSTDLPILTTRSGQQFSSPLFPGLKIRVKEIFES